MQRAQEKEMELEMLDLYQWIPKFMEPDMESRRRAVGGGGRSRGMFGAV
jgi:hypothetical protein